MSFKAQTLQTLNQFTENYIRAAVGLDEQWNDGKTAPKAMTDQETKEDMEIFRSTWASYSQSVSLSAESRGYGGLKWRVGVVEVLWLVCVESYQSRIARRSPTSQKDDDDLAAQFDVSDTKLTTADVDHHLAALPLTSAYRVFHDHVAIPLPKSPVYVSFLARYQIDGETAKELETLLAIQACTEARFAYPNTDLKVLMDFYFPAEPVKRTRGRKAKSPPILSVNEQCRELMMEGGDILSRMNDKDGVTNWEQFIEKVLHYFKGVAMCFMPATDDHLVPIEAGTSANKSPKHQQQPAVMDEQRSDGEEEEEQIDEEQDTFNERLLVQAFSQSDFEKICGIEPRYLAQQRQNSAANNSNSSRMIIESSDYARRRLNAVVQDPLPEVIANIGRGQGVRNTPRDTPDPKSAAVRQALKRALEAVDEDEPVTPKPAKKSYVIPGFTPGADKTPVNRIVKCGLFDAFDDDFEEPHLATPTRQPATNHASSFSPKTPGKQQRTRRVPWTDHEVELLANGMKKHGTSWAKILHEYAGEFMPGRTQVHLKDKARNEKLKRQRSGLELGVWEIACSTNR